MLVGHGATLWMLAHWLQEHPLEAVVGVFPKRPWHFALDPQHSTGITQRLLLLPDVLRTLAQPSP